MDKVLFILILIFSLNLKAEDLFKKLNEKFEVPFVNQYFNCNVFKTTTDSGINREFNNTPFVINRIDQTINFNDDLWINGEVHKLLYNKGMIKTQVATKKGLEKGLYITLQFNRINNKLDMFFYEYSLVNKKYEEYAHAEAWCKLN